MCRFATPCGPVFRRDHARALARHMSLGETVAPRRTRGEATQSPEAAVSRQSLDRQRPNVISPGERHRACRTRGRSPGPGRMDIAAGRHIAPGRARVGALLRASGRASPSGPSACISERSRPAPRDRSNGAEDHATLPITLRYLSHRRKHWRSRRRQERADSDLWPNGRKVPRSGRTRVVEKGAESARSGPRPKPATERRDGW
jgi:hypothetical protein